MFVAPAVLCHIASLVAFHTNQGPGAGLRLVCDCELPGHCESFAVVVQFRSTANTVS